MEGDGVRLIARTGKVDVGGIGRDTVRTSRGGPELFSDAHDRVGGIRTGNRTNAGLTAKCAFHVETEDRLCIANRSDTRVDVGQLDFTPAGETRGGREALLELVEYQELQGHRVE